MQYENEARVLFASKSVNESFARLFVAGFLSPLDLTVAEMTEIKTAVSEAVTNAIIHGYEGQEGMVELFCAYGGNLIILEISDYGTGIEDITLAREPLFTSKPEMERSGMGFTIMETFMDSLKVTSKIDCGTRVTMKKTFTRE